MNAARHTAILLADGAPRRLDAMRIALEGAFEVFTATSAEQALSILEDEWIPVVITDAALPDMAGGDLLMCIRDTWPETVRTIIGGAGPDWLEAVQDGAIQRVLPTPCGPEQLMLAAREGTRLFHLQREHERLSLEVRLTGAAPAHRQAMPAAPDALGFERIVRAEGSAMEGVCLRAAQFASFDVPALLEGETGTGKELLARAIHLGSLRADRPFMAVNCGAIPDELLESELFGHRRGAFTGAHADRRGLFEEADGGTVFLDEIGDTSPAFQVKLLRFLQEGEIRPVGSNETRHVDVRVIAATNRDLEAEARDGRFREDLYFRLAVAPLTIPPLRERPDDIAPLVTHLLEQAMAAHRKRVEGLEPGLMDFLAGYDWPGNIRELENEIMRLLMLADGDRLSAAHLSPRVLRAAPAGDAAADTAVTGRGTLKERVERMEARVLREVLTRHRWNKSRAAEELGLSRVGLRAKLERYGLEPGLHALEPDTANLTAAE